MDSLLNRARWMWLYKVHRIWNIESTESEIAMYLYNPKPQNSEGFRYSVESKVLWILGAWPVASGKSCFGIIYNYLSFANIAMVGYYVMCQAAYLWKNKNNIMEATENICTTGMGLLNFLRVVYMRLNQEKLKEIIKMFSDEIWFNGWAF